MENPKEDLGETEGYERPVRTTDGQGPRVVYVEPARPRRDWLDVVFRILAGFAMVIIIGLLASLLLVIVGLTGVMNSANASLSGAAQAVQSAGAAIEGPLQGLLGQVQPDRPPPVQTSQGPEFSQIATVAAGSSVPGPTAYTVTLSRIVKRAGAADPNQAQYAIFHRKLISPRPRTVGPVQVGEDYDEADMYMYKGESFRLGSTIYQVNWVSVEENAVGLVKFRNPDTVVGPVKYQVD